MDDYSSLAHRIAGGVADVRSCLILSRDGLILGSFPEDEGAVKPSWLRFASLGEPERSFVEFAGEVWAYLRRGPYAAFAIAGVGVRPGLLLDQLEQVLMAAEEARTRRETLKVPESPAAFSGKPRTSLHPPAGSPLEPAVTGADPRPWSRGSKPEPSEAAQAGGTFADLAPVADAGTSDGNGGSADEEPKAPRPKEGKGKAATDHGTDGKPGGETSDRDEGGPPDGKKRKKEEGRPAEPFVSDPSAPAGAITAATAAEAVADDPSPGGGTPSDGASARPELELEPDAEVDRVLLAKEFSGLLQVEAADDEAQS
jgi:hypothetical protein